MTKFTDLNQVYRQSFAVTQAERASQKLQSPKCIWLTGLSGSGKSTIANLLEQRLMANGRHVYVLDGDNLRFGLNQDLSFSDEDRAENIRRVSEVARLMVDAGLIVIVALISPFESSRNYARSLYESDQFLEVFVDTPLEICQQRDPKNLYAKAREGEIANFTGIGSRYEIPVNPELRLAAGDLSPSECVDVIIKMLK